jgi:hypothetical protein
VCHEAASAWSGQHVALYLRRAGRAGVTQTRAGFIPTVRLGRYFRYRAEAIRTWVEECETTTS